MSTKYTRLARTLLAFAVSSTAFSSLVVGAPERAMSSPPPKLAAAPAKPAAPSPPAATTPSSTLPTSNTQPVRLEEVEVSETRVSALTQAPTESSLDTYQPQSIINLQFLANNVAPTADYSTIANLAPSVANVVTNGPGLSDARRATLRGFGDSQYNVTYDGIPFADTNDFTHHTASYFPAKMIGRVTIDRGPGTAGSLGEATFGGTIALSSKDPRADMAIIPTLSFGSYATFLGHFEANSGLLHGLGDASAIASYQYMRTDGFQTNSGMKRDTTYVKYLQPIGKKTTITFLSNTNNIKFNNPLPISQAQIDARGRNFGLSSNPSDILYFGYNNRKNETDFEYLGIESSPVNSWHFDDKIYTYYYNNGSYDTTSLGTKAWNLGDIIGRFKLSNYRAWGNVFRASHEDPYGTLKFGVWLEEQRSKRNQYGLDWSRGKALDFDPAKSSSTAFFYDMINYLKTFQPFVEYEWRVNKQLLIDGGVRYVSFRRDLEANINQTTRTTLYYSKKTTEYLPSLSANYSIMNDWSVYAQAARGFLGPNLSQFYVPNPDLNKVKPQETMNYQVGTVYKKDRFSGDIDIYHIDQKNFPLTFIDPVTSQPFYALASGAFYDGWEAEGTYFVGSGMSLYANGSVNHAHFKHSKLDVPAVARQTAALGVLYDNNGFFGSLIDKYVGPSKIYAGTLNPDVASSVTAMTNSAGYWIADFAIGYGKKLPARHFIRSAKIRLQVNNVFDRKAQVVDAISGNVSFYNVLPDRNYFLSISGEF